MKANQTALNIRSDDRGYAAVIGGIIAVLLTILVCVMIYWKMSPAISDAVGGTLRNANTYQVAKLLNATNSTSNSVFTLAPIVGIVLIAGVILAIVMKFGRGDMV